MTARNTPISGPVGSDMTLFANAGVDAEVQIGLYWRAPDDEAVSILFGKEQLRLEFYDVESLERLRDVADQAARRLRAVIEANLRAGNAGREAAERPADVADQGEATGLVGPPGAVW